MIAGVLSSTGHQPLMWMIPRSAPWSLFITLMNSFSLSISIDAMIRKRCVPVVRHWSLISCDCSSGTNWTPMYLVTCKRLGHIRDKWGILIVFQARSILLSISEIFHRCFLMRNFFMRNHISRKGLYVTAIHFTGNDIGTYHQYSLADKYFNNVKHYLWTKITKPSSISICYHVLHFSRVNVQIFSRCISIQMPEGSFRCSAIDVDAMNSISSAKPMIIGSGAGNG